METIPIPVPMTPTAGITLVGTLVLLLVLFGGAVLLRILWRLPEREGEWVQRRGGAAAVQGGILRVLGFLAVPGGLVTGSLSNGVVIAALLLIAVTLRERL